MLPILLVEDNPADVERVSRFLRHQSDLSLRVAKTGSEALERLEKESFSCVLLDYHLPDTNGLELLQTLRKRFPELKVVFLTGHEDDRLFLGALRLGVIACLSKEKLTERLLTKTIRAGVGACSPPSIPQRPIAPLGLPPYEVYQTLIETMNEGVVVVDPDQIIVFVNPRMGEIVGCPAADLLGKKVTSLLTPGALPLFLQEWDKTVQGEACRYECEIEAATSGSTPVLVSQTPSYRRGGEIYGGLLVITDISRQKEIEKHLEQLSMTDGLTGLFNRRHFQVLLETEFQKARRHQHPLSCLMIDLDYFKRCNDTRGHLFGDRVLWEVGQLIRKEIRAHDILARYGGEEFILLFPNIPLLGAFEVAERIRASIAGHSFFGNGEGPRMTVSIGVAGTDDAYLGSSPEELIHSADSALYKAKRRGRNRVSVWER